MNDAELHNPAPGFERYPEHRIAITPVRGRAAVQFNQVTVADSEDFVVVDEDGHEPVVYLPPRDIATDMLTASDHRSYCSFKGEASYWTLTVANQMLQDLICLTLAPDAPALQA